MIALPEGEDRAGCEIASLACASPSVNRGTTASTAPALASWSLSSSSCATNARPRAAAAWLAYEEENVGGCAINMRQRGKKVIAQGVGD